MNTACTNCSTPFEVTDHDLQFLTDISPTFAGKRYDVPPPTHCPECRQQRRVAQGNQLFLYKRKCDLTGKEMISNYHEDDPYTVYDQEVWYSDQWDPCDYGRDFDFDRPFFEQFQELVYTVPQPSLQTGFQYDENAAYTNYAGKNKDCYLIFDSDENWDCYYSYSINGSRSCMENYRLRKGELCYECIDCIGCYGSAFLQDCDNCRDSYFLRNCIGCSNCLMCSNLRNKEYYVQNKQVSKEEFEKARASLRSFATLEAAKQRFATLQVEYPQKYMHGTQNENCTGDYLTQCKDCRHCFDGSNLWDCTYAFQAFNPLKTCMDIQECGDAERMYECSFMGYDDHTCLFSMYVLSDCSDMYYSMRCPHSKHCFGCCGMQHKEYCVFNKEYTKDEYDRLVGKIIEHMQNTPYPLSDPIPDPDPPTEWGEFYPITFSMFCYNESLAQEQFPITEKEAIAKGFKWRSKDEKEYQPASIQLPDSIDEVTDDITTEILACEDCSRNYKVIQQELNLYRQMGLPLPRKCFLCRNETRRKKRNNRTLYERTCDACSKDVLTTYEAERPENILCETCYLESLD